MLFSDLQLSADVLRAVADAGYAQPTPIQEQAIPYILMGRDILGCAQTGTGKTASFALPMIDIMSQARAKARMPRALIIEPTRELAAQVAEAFDLYGKYHKLNKGLLIGGESMGDQLKVLDRGVDVLIATPGRLLDVFDRGKLLLNDVRTLVIDEADRMLDMGFIPDVERIVSLVNRTRQTLFFSATMPPMIRRLADAFLNNPKEIIISAPATPAATLTQGIVIVSHSGAGGLKEKREALRRLIEQEQVTTALIFCNRKREVGILHRSLVRHGYDATMLHGDLAQATRTEVLEQFRRGETRLLVCSDVAARGLDIEGVSHVFNYDVPSNAEDYVHRIGRTGRAGRLGRAFTVAVPEDGKYVTAIERLIGTEIPRIAVGGTATADLAPSTSSNGKHRRRGGKPAEKQRHSATHTGGRRPVEAALPATQPAELAPPRQRDAEALPSRSSEIGSSEMARATARRSSSGAPARKPAVINPAPPPPPPARGRSPRRSKEPPDIPVVGMGDHVPAFMLREPTLRKKPS
ncbi:DEAD/DEAH box helicase [Defluviicoccus vanus]|uniref:DEAD-box ATP-dependent RNA helicase RhpA n=1 Tax=Defluviicoccus vanus TaxID=111831 RepID=A0A7H1MYG1_9PROT|nr:DEAD/DEAH box helicase [Defluviicoccus vanus]QNT68497.1 DEAD/DEAH box helicase [Defluviicoccus vanus]